LGIPILTWISSLGYAKRGRGTTYAKCYGTTVIGLRMEETSLPSTNVKTRELCKVEKFECSAKSRSKTKIKQYETK
jgi:hypothetical protein